MYVCGMANKTRSSHNAKRPVAKAAPADIRQLSKNVEASAKHIDRLGEKLRSFKDSLERQQKKITG